MESETLAAFIFVYRRDTEKHAGAWQAQAELLIAVVKDSTQALTAMHTLLQALQEELTLRDPIAGPLIDRRARCS